MDELIDFAIFLILLPLFYFRFFIDHIFAVDWHPESRYTLASAGRDKQIKIWNTKDAKLEYFVQSIGPVGKVMSLIKSSQKNINIMISL